MEDENSPTVDVFCQMPQAISMIGNEIEMKVDNCDQPACYKSDNISYNDASMEQIVALINGSSSCKQTIEVDCTSAPIVDLVSMFQIF